MNTSSRASRTALVAGVAGALLTAVTLSACGAASSNSGGGGAAGASSSSSSPKTSGAASASPSASAATSAAGTPTATRSTVSTPAGGPVPSGFAGTSVTFVSADEGFVLGTAPCAKAPCTSILRTLDRGASWRGLPAPVVMLGNQYDDGSSPAVWGIRFANPSDGFVFGNGLWETTDGGEHWTSAVLPAGSIRSLEIIDGQVLALTTVCTPNGGCGRAGTLERRPLAGGSWHRVAQVTGPGVIATQAKVAAVLDGSSVLITANGGLSTVTQAGPCGAAEVPSPAAVAVTGPDGLALECAGEGAAGSVQKTVYVSDDLGVHWQKAGSPAYGGDPGGLSAGSASRLVATASSGGSFLYHSGDGGARWSTAFFAGDGGLGFNDLGFTTPADGVVVYGPVFSDNNADGRPGQLLLTSNGGASWRKVSY